MDRRDANYMEAGVVQGKLLKHVHDKLYSRLRVFTTLSQVTALGNSRPTMSSHTGTQPLSKSESESQCDSDSDSDSEGSDGSVSSIERFELEDGTPVSASAIESAFGGQVQYVKLLFPRALQMWDNRFTPAVWLFCGIVSSHNKECVTAGCVCGCVQEPRFWQGMIGLSTPVVIKLVRNDATELMNLRELGKRSELRIIPVRLEAVNAVPGWTAVVMPLLTPLKRLFRPTREDFTNIVTQLMQVCECGGVVFGWCFAIIARVLVWTQICRAWENAGLVHGDLKPSNIVVTWNGIVYVLDVETVVKLDPSKSYTPTPAGFRYTPEYEPPEHIGRSVVCSKSDLYSVGVTLLKVGKVRGCNCRPVVACVFRCVDSLCCVQMHGLLTEAMEKALTGLTAVNPADRVYVSVG